MDHFLQVCMYGYMESERWLNYERHKQRQRYVHNAKYTAKVRHGEDWLTRHKIVVRPHLEYCVQVWSPVAKHGNWGIIMAIEKCQRDFTRIIHGMGFLSYSERLQKLGLTTLLERRMRGDLIEAYKIINGHVNYGHQMFNHNLHYSTRNLCNVSFCRTRFALHCFSVRVIKYWNNLPNSVKNAPSVNAFKTGLDYLKSYNPDSRHGYWYLSQEIFNRIPDKNDHVTYLKSHPEVAMRRHISCF